MKWPGLNNPLKTVHRKFLSGTKNGSSWHCCENTLLPHKMSSLTGLIRQLL